MDVEILITADTVQDLLTCLHEAIIRIALRAAKDDLNFFEEALPVGFVETCDNCDGVLVIQLADK